jgi:hypothetical protein
MGLAPPGWAGNLESAVSFTRPQWTALVVAALLPLAFAAFTRHAWEDYFITLRSSRHLVEGHGLVFNPGERVHTFTSPLGVVVPALCTALAGPDREETALWIFRLVNAALLAGAAALLWRRATSLGLGWVGQVALFALLFLEAKLIDFSINGMETALLVFFTLLLWCEVESRASPRPPVIAIAVAGLMWTRPDAFLLAGAILGARVAIRDPAETTPRAAPRLLRRGLLLGGLFYLPWFAWAWWYYGTPVPHTVVAKSAYTPLVHWEQLLLIPWRTLLGQSMLLDLFLPAYWNFGGWPSLLPHLAHALSGIAAFAWLVPAFPTAARRASFAVFVGMFYLCSIVLFPWYVPPWTALAALALAFLLDAFHRTAVDAGRQGLAQICRSLGATLVVVQVAVLVAVAWQMRVGQSLVEEGVRRGIGVWLRQHAARSDTVFLEPLGYIGYFSQLKTYDFPGLSSPEVVAAVRSGARRYADVIARLQPDWVVLRPAEAARPEFAQTGVLRHYEHVKTWDASPQLASIHLLPGRGWLEAEAQFLLFRKKRAGRQPP